MNDITIWRNTKYLTEQIRLFSLDLSGLTVYTELGWGNYAFPPLIAALANAKKVYAITRTSRFGTADVIVTDFRHILDCVNLPEKTGVIEVVQERNKKHWKEADIITNLGFVRPIDKEMISCLKPTAVVSLMYETWEYRKEDIDLDWCRKNDILVLGLNEECPPVDMMKYSGYLVCKLLFERGLGVHKDTILLIGSGRIGNNIADFFRINGVDFSWICLDGRVRSENAGFVQTAEYIRGNLETFDAIILAEMYHNQELIGNNGLITTLELSEKNPSVQLIHICGNIDYSAIKTENLEIYPEPVMPFGYMTVSVNHLDYKATMQLLTAGLKVGEIMARNRLHQDFITSYKQSIKNPLVDDFKGGFIIC